MIVALASTTSAEANDNHRVSRYTLFPLTADFHEKDLLSTIIETKFPAQVATVGSAIDYVLMRSGYRHVPTEAVSNALRLPLPMVHRSIGPMDTRSALQTLIGSSWNLFENEERRVIWFQYAGSSLDSTMSGNDSQANSPPETTSPQPIQIQNSTGSQDWTLDPSKSLRQNLEEWAIDANWRLEWNSHHDYEILHSAIYSGPLEVAVAAVLEHYRNAPFVLAATFFRGNSVVLIESIQTTKH